MYSVNIILVGNLAGYKIPQGIATNEMSEEQQKEVARFLFDKGRLSELTDKGHALFKEKVYLCDEMELSDTTAEATHESEPVKEKQNAKQKPKK